MAKIRVKKAAAAKQAVQPNEAVQTEAANPELPATAQQDEAPTTEAAVEQLKKGVVPRMIGQWDLFL